MFKSFCDGRVDVLVGDITQVSVDAIVNAANSTLMGGGGVDGAIHKIGGPKILEECKEVRRTLYPNGLPTGEVVVTSGGNLPAKYVIHTVGPIKGRNNDRDAELLAACYRNALAIAVEHNLESIAFPSISTGAFGYPRDEAARVSSTAIKSFLRTDQSIKKVQLIFFSLSDAELFIRYQCFDSDRT
jgi:O-acetyl-ADP-ribose deacetylase (regulator of RNase III)